jgi:ABC-type methionine transport system ATPase subunit
MPEKKVHLTFNEKAVSQPLISQIVKKFDVEINIKCANISKDAGFVELALSGSEKSLKDAVDFLTQHGVRVDAITHDVLES